MPKKRKLQQQKLKPRLHIQLVQEAIREKKSNPPGDIFWVVYDRESTHKYPDSLHAEARRKAKANNIKIAFSNVCFEVWILLHFQKTVPAFTSYEDLRKHSKLEKHINNYDKGAKVYFSKKQIDEARLNAKLLNNQTKAGADQSWSKHYQWNPYTDVYKLLDDIDKFEKKYS